VTKPIKTKLKKPHSLKTSVSPNKGNVSPSMGASSSKVSLNSNRFGLGVNGIKMQGWNSNDLTLANIMAKFIQMGMSIVELKVM
jgi:hypothetical protein